ncbi:glycosyltransferase family 71 protein [Mixia osmundae IAM 14324]|uniref:Uncharacterized protein n=1 Tax=Mixia osmundae (strain CBS 9802 / IAM 14324 / JCM 22182 / KY 12970) TaxID=764103 RepID=G7DZ60_MIXOS|nr:glycosyltransferase family 71 protein [Mixia osmundae IAM 14324]KEI38271.1 glycosyltransferase family 71 protein [Mixia osmundae IAM 14324]GAA95870.1 hypothetical protein E5Q_02527 [Mixia osmundae IAM 14324]
MQAGVVTGSSFATRLLHRDRHQAEESFGLLLLTSRANMVRYTMRQSPCALGCTIVLLLVLAFVIMTVTQTRHSSMPAEFEQGHSQAASAKPANDMETHTVMNLPEEGDRASNASACRSIDPNCKSQLMLSTSRSELEEWLRSHASPMALASPLAARLSTWQAVPPAETATFVAINRLQCSSAKIAHNVQDEMGLAEVWASLSAAELASMREDLIDSLGAVTQARVGGSGKGRGIVMIVAPDQFDQALITLRMIRRYGADLSIEIFSYETEVTPSGHLHELRELNVYLRKLTGVSRWPDYRGLSTQIRASAIIDSSFDEVLMIDADTLPLQDLGGTGTDHSDVYIFESIAYRRLGVMIWPLARKQPPHNPVWQLLGVPCRNEWTADSSVLLIDKTRHIDVLRLIEQISLGPHAATWTTLVGTSGDAFRFALLALRKRWAVPGKAFGLLHSASRSGSCRQALLHYDHRGLPIFAHLGLSPVKNLTEQAVWNRATFMDVGRERSTDLDIDADHLVDAALDGSTQTTRHDQPVLRSRAALELGLSLTSSCGGTACCFELAFRQPLQVTTDEIDWRNPLRTESVQAHPILRQFSQHYFAAAPKYNNTLS